ncbi:MAG: hypothetical protein M5R36_03220 [Deltaproteobacteria bacterium]|nr:hypothetical protein [Deltaproteobacteria bacterium]
MDAPVLAFGTHLISQTDFYEEYRDRLPPVREQDLPRTEYGYEITYIQNWDHMDPVFGKKGRNPFFDEVLDFMSRYSSGTVQVPASPFEK